MCTPQEAAASQASFCTTYYILVHGLVFKGILTVGSYDTESYCLYYVRTPLVSLTSDPCRQFQAVWDDNDAASAGEEHLAALTAWDRKSWAETRDTHFSSGVNKESMDIIEKVDTRTHSLLHVQALIFSALLYYVYIYFI